MELAHLSKGTPLQGGKYKILHFISSGGFGCTYEAEHVLLEKRVAIKEFFVKDFCNRDETTAHITVGTISKKGLVEKLRKKFFDEAKAVCQLEHPGIVRVSDVFEENGTAYFVMDYINGKSLSDIVNNEGALSEQQTLKYIHQVAEALRYVHDNNRLHLDVKPGNIMIDEHDNAILIDFGASKQYDEVNGENTSTLMGKTPGYAPIEQMGNNVVTFTPATDIYALGATMYKLLTGITPIESNLIAGGEKLAPLPRGTSKNVAEAIAASMQYVRTRRPQTIEEFLLILNDRGSEGGEETIISTHQPPSQSQYQSPSPSIDARVAQKPQPSVNNIKPVVAVMPKEETPVAKTEKKTILTKLKANNTLWIVVSIVVALVVAGIVWGVASMGRKKLSPTEILTSEQEKEANAKQVTLSKQIYNGVTYFYDGPINSKYKPEGSGKGVYPTGTYKGQYVNGCREGLGVFTTKDGKNTFKGVFKDDKYNEGTLTLDDGSYYVGTFQDDTPYTGVWYEADGSVYCGYKDGNPV